MRVVREERSLTSLCFPEYLVVKNMPYFHAIRNECCSVYIVRYNPLYESGHCIIGEWSELSKSCQWADFSIYLWQALYIP